MKIRGNGNEVRILNLRHEGLEFMFRNITHAYFKQRREHQFGDVTYKDECFNVVDMDFGDTKEIDGMINVLKKFRDACDEGMGTFSLHSITEKHGKNKTPMYRTSDAIKFIRVRADIDEKTIAKVVGLEEEYLRLIGIIEES